MYAFAAVALVSAIVSGYGVREYMQGQILQCEMAIERGNAQSKALLDAAIAQTEKHNLEQAIKNEQLEKSQRAGVDLANSYIDRLRESQRASSNKNTVSKANCSGVLEERPRLNTQARCDELLGRSLKVIVWKDSALAKLNDNCGMPK